MNLAYETSDCYLASPSGKPICKLNGIDILSANLSKDMSDFSEFSFDLYRFIDVDGNIVESNGYKYVKNKMYLYLSNFGWFKITDEPHITFESGTEKKHVVAQSVECELLQHDLVGFKINTGEVDSLEYLADNNIAANGLAKEYILFYREDNPQLSLLDLILEKVRGWEIGHIDDELKNKKFTFDISSKPIYSFIRDDLQKQARCIFVFNIMNRTIDIYTVENFGLDTSIYISFRNLANTIDVACEDRSIYTCYNVAGGEGLDNINQVNFGSSYIEDLSYYACQPYMESLLSTKYKNWLSYREQLRPQYISVSKQYNYYSSIALEIKNRVPLGDLSNTWTGYSLDELEKHKAYYEANIKAIDDEFERTGKDIKKYPIYYTYIQYKEILSDIESAIAALESGTEIEQSEWLNNPDIYGLDELSYKIESYKEQLSTFKYKNDFIDKDGNYRTWESLTKTEKKRYSTQVEYEQKRDLYKQINDLYLSFSDAFNTRTEEYNTVSAKAKTYLSEVQRIQRLSLIENYSEGFTDDELTVLNRLRNYTDYKNENIVYVDTYDTEQSINMQEELLNDAKEQLVISSQPQINFSTDIDNLTAITEYKPWSKILDVGVFIYLELRDDYKVKVRVTNISGINPFDNQESSLEISFSNMIKGIHGIDDYSYLLNNSMVSSKNSINVESSSTTPDYILTVDKIKLSTETLNNIATSQVFQDKFQTVYNSIVIPTDAKINESISAQGIQGDSDFASMVNTNSGTIISKGSEKDIIKYKLTATKDSDIICLLSVPFQSDLDGILTLRYYLNGTLVSDQITSKYFLSGYDVLTACNYFPILLGETLSLKITIQSSYCESDYRKNNSRLESIERYINTGSYSSTDIDGTTPTVKIQPSAIRSAVLGSGLELDTRWDGTINLEDTFNSVEFSGLSAIPMNDTLSISKQAEGCNTINESISIVDFAGLSVVGINDEVIFDEVIDNYTFNTSKANRYEYDTDFVSDDLAFRLKISDVVTSNIQVIDEGKMCSIKINTSKYKSVSAIELEVK